MDQRRPPNPRHRVRRVAPPVALLVLMLLLSGCVTIRSQSTAQRAPGVITLAITVCASDDDQSVYAACDSSTGTDGTIQNTEEKHNSGEAQFDGLGQLLIAFRVPAATTAPQSFISDGGDVFTLSPSYIAELVERFPPAAGFRWVGYLSSPKVFDHDDTSGLITTVRPEFGLPPQPDGGPMATPLRWRAVAGFRPLDSAGQATQPVQCGNSCFDSPALAKIPTDIFTPVSDFGVLAGQAATAGQGATATISFPVRYLDDGGEGPQELRLSASTTLPGATATASTATLTAAPGSTTAVAVRVPVPAGAPLGDFAVRLTAAAGTPAVVRTGTATLRVADRVAPAIRLGTPADGAGFVRGQAVLADYACTDGGSAIARCAGPVAPGAQIDTRTVGPKTFTVTAADAAGNAATATAAYTVLPKPAPDVDIRFAVRSSARATIFTKLAVKDIPKGSKVTARCAGRGRCNVRRFVRRKAAGRVVLRPFVGKPIGVGAVIDVRVTHKGSIGAVKLIRIRARKAPAITDRCLPPGTSAPRKRC